MRAHLEGRGIDPAAVDQAIRMLTDRGYVDDARFARLFTQDKRELAQWGSERIRRRLLARGLDRELVEATLAERPDAEPREGEAPDGELGRALALLRGRFPSPPCNRRERDRALGVLLRRGYDSELALDALRLHGRGVESP